MGDFDQMMKLSEFEIEQRLIVGGWLSFDAYLKLSQKARSLNLSVAQILYQISRESIELHTQLFEFEKSQSYKDAPIESSEVMTSTFNETLTISAPGQGKIDSLIQFAFTKDHSDPLWNTDDYYSNTLNQSELIEENAVSGVMHPSHEITVSTWQGFDDELKAVPHFHQESLNELLTSQGMSKDSSRYTYVERIGRGGMSVVDCMHDLKMDRDVAFKRVLKTSDANTLRSFEIEARVTGRLEHPNIIPIYDFVNDSRELGYTMRIARYNSLADRIYSEVPLEPHDLCTILRQVALAVEYAHQRGVIHRDIKPHNILLGNEGEVYLTDWGVCHLDLSHPDADLVDSATRNALVGSPVYMPPEQARCDMNALGGQSDVYGLGATLYHCLTDRPPFEGDSLVDILRSVINSKDRDIQDEIEEKSKITVPRELQSICAQAMAYEPEQRFSSARSFADALESFQKGQLERERLEAEMRVEMDRAEEARSRFHMLSKKRASLEYEVKRLRRQRKLGDSEKKSDLWTHEEVIDSLASPIEEAFARATAAYRNALFKIPDLKEAKQALIELFWVRLEEAEELHDLQKVAYFEELIRKQGNQEAVARLDQPSRIVLENLPPLTVIEVWTHHPHRYRTMSKLLYEHHSPLDEAIELARGSYLIKLSHPHAEPTCIHLHLSRASTRSLKVELPRKGSVPQGFVYVPNSDGGRGLAFGESPVKCLDYFTFLNSLPHEEAEFRAPRYNNTIYVKRDQDGLFSLPFTDLEGDEWGADWPIMLVNLYDAQAYADWLSDQMKRTVRLPTADEWTHAAQGADHRRYPWGSAFDSSLCRMRDSTRGRTMPCSVGSLESDQSPYGLYDVAGNIAQWTTSLVEGTEEVHRVKGAAFNSIELLCDLTQEQETPASSCMIHIGIRLVVEMNSEDYL